VTPFVENQQNGKAQRNGDVRFGIGRKAGKRRNKMRK